MGLGWARRWDQGARWAPARGEGCARGGAGHRGAAGAGRARRVRTCGRGRLSTSLYVTQLTWLGVGLGVRVRG